MIIFPSILLAAAVAATATNAPAAGWILSGTASATNGHLFVSAPDTSHSGAARIAFDLAPFRDRVLTATVRCRGKGIGHPDRSWNGLKFMFRFVDGVTGIVHWPNTDPRLGDFDWTNLVVSTDLSGMEPEQGSLTLGLQGACGSVEFDLSTLRLSVAPSPYIRTNESYRVSYPATTAAIPQLRGVMLPAGPCKEDDFKTLQAWHVTLARYQMVRNWGAAGTELDLDEYDRWLDSKLDHLEQVLVWANRYGLRIVVDLHQPPGGRLASSEMRMFYEKKYADHFVAVWRRIAARFKGRPEIFGYDLVNEPLQKGPAPYDYWTLQRLAAEAVRSIDPDTPIIVESNEWDSPSAFRYLSPLAMSNVIYQVHMYKPGEFTHQGVRSADGGSSKRVTYPNPERGWDRGFLRRSLQPVREFQKAHGCRIYVGEFSAINWAPGSDRYIADCIFLFNEFGWDWTFHAFREWPGWSVEHVGESAAALRPSTDNPRKQALLRGLREQVAPDPRCP